MTDDLAALVAEIKAKASARNGRNEIFSVADVLRLIEALETAETEKQKLACDGVAREGHWIERTGEMQAEIDRLREALKPFAIEANKYDPPEDDDDHLPFGVNITIGNLRRAREALKGA